MNSNIDQYNKGFSHGISAKEIIGCSLAVIVTIAAVALCLICHFSYLIGIYIGCIPAAIIIMTTFGEREGYGNMDVFMDRVNRKDIDFEADEAEEEIETAMADDKEEVKGDGGKDESESI